MKILYKISLLFSMILVAASCSDEKFFEESRWDETVLEETQVYVLTLTEQIDDFQELWVYYQTEQVYLLGDVGTDGNVGEMKDLSDLSSLVDSSYEETLGDDSKDKFYEFTFDAVRDNGVSSYHFVETADNIGTLTVTTAGAVKVYPNVDVKEVTKKYDPTYSAK